MDCFTYIIFSSENAMEKVAAFFSSFLTITRQLEKKSKKIFSTLIQSLSLSLSLLLTHYALFLCLSLSHTHTHYHLFLPLFCHNCTSLRFCCIIFDQFSKACFWLKGKPGQGCVGVCVCVCVRERERERECERENNVAHIPIYFLLFPDSSDGS
jgi:hypothetical protein